MRQTLYIWQRHWTEDVAAAVAQAAPTADAFLVLAGEVERTDHAARYVRVRVNWPSLAETERPVWLVHRVVAGLLSGEVQAQEDIITFVESTLVEAEDNGVRVAGIQMDYDCPTETLPGYGRFLKALQQRLPDHPLSITALPTWLRHRELQELLPGLDHLVLQVHSLDRPVDIHSPLVLCDTEKIPHWLALTAALETPFYVALPTYSYRVYFDATGAFLSLGAEMSSERRAEHGYRDAGADPVALAGVVRALRQARPAELRGIAWFRLPVAADKFNWTWPTLATVMQGEAPRPALTAEVIAPREGLFELYLSNHGEYQPRRLRVTLALAHDTVTAADAINGFVFARPQQRDRIELEGPAPASGEYILIAWWTTPAAATTPAHAATSPIIEVLP